MTQKWTEIKNVRKSTEVRSDLFFDKDMVILNNKMYILDRQKNQSNIEEFNSNAVKIGVEMCTYEDKQDEQI